METVTQQNVLDAFLHVLDTSKIPDADKIGIKSAVQNELGSTQRDVERPVQLKRMLAQGVFTAIIRGIDGCNYEVRAFADRQSFGVLKSNIRELRAIYGHEDRERTRT